MKIRYDPDADAMLIELREEKVDYTEEKDADTLIHYNKNGNLISVELLFVSERIPSPLKEIQIENLAAITA